MGAKPLFRLMPDADTLTLWSVVVPLTHLMCSFLLLNIFHGVTIFELELINFIPGIMSQSLDLFAI